MSIAGNSRRPLWLFGGLLLLLLLIALCWRFAWDSDWLSVEQTKQVIATAAGWHGELWLWPLLVAVFVVLLLLMFPLTILVVLTGFLYGPWWGFCYATLGTLVSAMVSYEIGRLTGQKALLQFGGRRLLNISRYIGDRGIRTMIVISILPLAPFTLTNIMAGASHIRFWPYLAGSAIGIIPGIALVNFAGSQLNALLQSTDTKDVVVSVSVIALIVLIILYAPRWLKKYIRRRSSR
ncbi:TVP38/TMEM64 family protein [Arsukibacterium sp.]|uniref:TVP38/TMEM64 family protein n=1 Tax=Arsukibacterium sp. TaxID=1977258 RepID=UPI00299E26A4|nr:VTT domain-containing protein [Arsukibacterium sp.]MDX1678010.1 VTT domain-containing protein [Arsukibacterium sp.]